MKPKKLIPLVMSLLFGQSRQPPATIDWNAEDEHFIKILKPSLFGMLRECANEILNPFEVESDEDRLTGFIDGYTFNLVKGINDHSASVIREALAEYGLGEMTRGELGEMIARSGIYSPARADLIGNTETTRMLAKGAEVAKEELAAEGIVMIERWHTTIGGNPCDECLRRNGRLRGDGWYDLPPIHPGCQCSVTLEIVEE